MNDLFTLVGLRARVGRCRGYYTVGVTDVIGMSTELKYSGSLERSDPLKTPVTIIGQLEHLQSLPFNVIKTKLEPRVTEDVRNIPNNLKNLL